MAGNASLDADVIFKFIEPFGGEEKFTHRTSFSFHGGSAPSQTDHSEASTLFTDHSDTWTTWQTSIQSHPEALSALQYGQDASSYNTIRAEVFADDAFPAYDSNANPPRAPILIPEGPSTPARPNPSSRLEPSPPYPRPGRLTNYGDLAPHGGFPPQQRQLAKGTRNRTVKDREKTAAMRGMVCLRCKICKTECEKSEDKSGNCKGCENWCPENPGPLCTRDNLEQVLGTGAGHKRWGNAGLDVPRLKGSIPDTSDSRPINVVFTASDPEWLRVDTYLHSEGQSQGLWGMVPNHLPSEREFLKWATSRLRKKTECDYRGAVDSFLVKYVATGHPVKAYIRDLVENVVKMSAMWHILNSRMLYHRAEPHTEIQDVDEVVLVQIQRRAQQIMYSVEHDILKVIDDFTSGPVLDKKDRPEIWAIFWSLILMYRHTLVSCQRLVVVEGGFSNSNYSEDSQPRDGFVTVTRGLLHKLIVVYATLFRTSQSQHTLDSSDTWTFRNNPQLCLAFEEARKAVFRFYEEVPKRGQEHDEIIDKYIIEWEGKVKNRKPWKQKTGDRKKGVAAVK